MALPAEIDSSRSWCSLWVSRNVLVSFNGNIKGRHDITLIDLQGRNLLVKNVNVTGKQTERITLPSQTAGMYMVKITNDAGNDIFADRLVVVED